MFEDDAMVSAMNEIAGSYPSDQSLQNFTIDLAEVEIAGKPTLVAFGSYRTPKNLISKLNSLGITVVRSNTAPRMADDPLDTHSEAAANWWISRMRSLNIAVKVKSFFGTNPMCSSKYAENATAFIRGTSGTDNEDVTFEKDDGGMWAGGRISSGSLQSMRASVNPKEPNSVTPMKAMWSNIMSGRITVFIEPPIEPGEGGE